MTKAEIRSKYLALRLNLSNESYMELNHQLFERFFKDLNLSSFKTIHIFLPILSKKEPDTWPIIYRLQKDFPDVRISIPKIENNLISNFYYQQRNQLQLNSWGILEPQGGVPTPSEEIDVVVVPLLAFDAKGNRVGYGKGFYDRFLKTCRPDCRKIGLSFFDATSESLPADIHDVPLNYAITPDKFFQFL